MLFPMQLHTCSPIIHYSGTSILTGPTCQAVKRAPPVAPLHPWVWPSRPWQRVNAGPFQGSMFLIAVDATPSGLR